MSSRNWGATTRHTHLFAHRPQHQAGVLYAYSTASARRPLLLTPLPLETRLCFRPASWARDTEQRLHGLCRTSPREPARLHDESERNIWDDRGNRRTRHELRRAAPPGARKLNSCQLRTLRRRRLADLGSQDSRHRCVPAQPRSPGQQSATSTGWCISSLWNVTRSISPERLSTIRHGCSERTGEDCGSAVCGWQGAFAQHGSSERMEIVPQHQPAPRQFRHLSG